MIQRQTPAERRAFRCWSPLAPLADDIDRCAPSRRLGEFYELVLGPSMNYYCAVVFPSVGQEAVYELVPRKRGPRPRGVRLLEAGEARAGW